MNTFCALVNIYAFQEFPHTAARPRPLGPAARIRKPGGSPAGNAPQITSAPGASWSNASSAFQSSIMRPSVI